jgi:hypothetical protein
MSFLGRLAVRIGWINGATLELPPNEENPVSKEEVGFDLQAACANLPALKSSMACRISAWLFMTNGP